MKNLLTCFFAFLLICNAYALLRSGNMDMPKDKQEEILPDAKISVKFSKDGDVCLHYAVPMSSSIYKNIACIRLYVDDPERSLTMDIPIGDSLVIENGKQFLVSSGSIILDEKTFRKSRLCIITGNTERDLVIDLILDTYLPSAVSKQAKERELPSKNVVPKSSMKF